MRYNPLKGKVVVEPITEEKTKEGIFIPTNSKSNTIRAKVISISSMRDLSSEIEEESIVLFNKNKGEPLEDSLIVIEEKDILAIIEEE